VTARRVLADRVVRGLCAAAAVVALVPLAVVLSFLVVRGVSAFSLSFFTELPKPPGEPRSGIANAILGTAEIVGLAALVGVPVGMSAGVYLAEYGRGRFSTVVRFAADVLAGVPSIVVGMFVYAVVVVPMQRFSALAGALALAVLMVPTVTRTTEELLRLVPDSLREGGLALGVDRARVVLRIVLPTAAAGVATGVVLAVARVSGETAPLLFTSLGSTDHPRYVDQPTASLTVQIFQYAGSPFPEQQAQAWGAALVLVMLVLGLDLLARRLTRRFDRGGVR
jgi:phosphate transport system permease protein